MILSSISKDWSVQKPSAEFGKKTGQHAALVTGAFLVELVDVLYDGMDEDRMQKHYMQPALEGLYKVIHGEDGVNPYSAFFRLTPSMIVLAQKDIEQKINNHTKDANTDLKALKEIKYTLDEARENVGPVYERIDTPREDGIDSATFFFLEGKISAEEASEMSDLIDQRRFEM